MMLVQSARSVDFSIYILHGVRSTPPELLLYYALAGFSLEYHYLLLVPSTLGPMSFDLIA